MVDQKKLIIKFWGGGWISSRSLTHDKWRERGKCGLIAQEPERTPTFSD